MGSTASSYAASFANEHDNDRQRIRASIDRRRKPRIRAKSVADGANTPADTKPTDHTPAEPADSESASHTPAESADSERVDNEQKGSQDPLTAGTEPPHETTTDNSPDRDHRASTPLRAPP